MQCLNFKENELFLSQYIHTDRDGVFEEKEWKTREREASGRSIRTRVMKISISGFFCQSIFSLFRYFLFISTNKTDQDISACMSSASERICLYEN